jgi:hypothetical protein
LNLTPGPGGSQDSACVIGEITRRIIEVPVTSQGKRSLRITRNTKIRMVEQVISFHSNRNLPSFSDRKIFVVPRQIARTPAPQNISSGIANLPTGGTARALR